MPPSGSNDIKSGSPKLRVDVGQPASPQGRNHKAAPLARYVEAALAALQRLTLYRLVYSSGIPNLRRYRAMLSSVSEENTIASLKRLMVSPG
jgi:hypothetical protein